VKATKMTEAFDEEKHKEGYELFLPLAEQGDADAQSRIGEMHLEGQGVPKNYVTAQMWFNLSASNGNKNGLVEGMSLQRA
jgi:uncharacterized protein